MILAQGKLYSSKEQDRILSEMERNINRTLSEPPLKAQTVISAVDSLGRDIGEGKYDDIISNLPVDDPQRYKALAAQMLSREYLELKLKTELGLGSLDMGKAYTTGEVYTSIFPLGVIFHIAAGNMDGLPAFSIAEGLLTGNINILKLPQADNGLSTEIIGKLIEYEPALADYIYVFDTPSTDIHAMAKMAEMADGIAVWGGDEATAAVRRLAPSGAKLIEWGHKLGFAYISGEYDSEELKGLAEHIVSTKQLLCSSCQVIYIDTESDNELNNFCDVFLPVLEKAATGHSAVSIGGRAHRTLLDYTDMLEGFLEGGALKEQGLYKGKGCSLKVCNDSELELSPMMCNVLVKKLPRENIVSVLRRKKGYLQTAGLLCGEKDREALSGILARCGITRITGLGDMSEFFAGEGHDGEYPLRRYVRVVNRVMAEK